MQTKILSAVTLFICFATIGHAQNDNQFFKLSPAPFNYKTPLHLQYLKPLPFKGLQNANDSLKFGYKTNLGEVFINTEDGMPVLKPFPQMTDYERRQVLKPYRVEPFGAPSYVDPMPNPLKKALISK